MIHILFIMCTLIGAGFLWGRYNPARMDAGLIRKVLADSIYYLFLPTLVLKVLWQAELGMDSARIATGAGAGVLLSLAVAWMICSRQTQNPNTLGAALLAAGFPNATYLGYPVLLKTFGDWAGPVAIQYDLFACTPILLSLGILIAARLGGCEQQPNPLLLLAKVPPLWAAFFGSLFNVAGIPQPEFIQELLALTSAVVVPVMLFVIGLALSGASSTLNYKKILVSIVCIQLFFMPVAVFFTTTLTGSTPLLTQAITLEGAMPSMALGVVICDRYGLDSALYAMAVTVTTLVSLFTLPLWYTLL